MDLDALDARLRRLEDERELRELLAAYGFTADLGHHEAYAGLYTDDGVIDVGARQPPGRFEGRQAIHDGFITGPAHLAIEHRCQHHALCGPVVFRIDGDEAWAEGYSLVIVQSDLEQRQACSGRAAKAQINVTGANFNHWEFRRVDGRWRISKRVNREIGSDGAHEAMRRAIATLADGVR